jgi:hypothetical protein
MLGIGLEGSDALAVDAGRTRIRTDRDPGACEIARIGDLLQELADGQHLLSLPATLLAP